MTLIRMSALSMFIGNCQFICFESVLWKHPIESRYDPRNQSLYAQREIDTQQSFEVMALLSYFTYSYLSTLSLRPRLQLIHQVYHWSQSSSPKVAWSALESASPSIHNKTEREDHEMNNWMFALHQHSCIEDYANNDKQHKNALVFPHHLFVHRMNVFRITIPQLNMRHLFQNGFAQKMRRVIYRLFFPLFSERILLSLSRIAIVIPPGDVHAGRGSRPLRISIMTPYQKRKTTMIDGWPDLVDRKVRNASKFE